ncbi:hypothetical protein BC332_27116 [Capsicum chinense]|nr:hypothetical protein BC332_27116 [Capsicum chinense]
MAHRSIWEEDMVIDIMGMILKRVSIGDYVRMAAVSKSWRSMLAAHHKPSHDLEAPWLLQLKDCAYNHDTGFNFYSLSDARFYTFKLPIHVLNKYPNVLACATTFCCATSNGWLVIIVARLNHKPDMFLFDPISEIDIKLPSLTTIPFYSIYVEENMRIPMMVNRVHVFSTSDDPTRNIIVAAHFMDLLNHEDFLAFCNCDIGVTEEERSWEIVDADGAISCHNINIESMLFHNGVLYTLISNKDYDFAKVKSSQDGERIGEEIDHVVVLKTGIGCCEVKMKITNIVKHSTAPHIWASDDELRVIAYSGLTYVYLAKSIMGEMLIIWNKTDPLSEYDDDDLSIYHTSNFTVERYEGIYKTSKNFEPITSLDDQAIFVSPNSDSFSIPARSDHRNGCQANSIYFTADALDVLYKRSLILYRQSGTSQVRKFIISLLFTEYKAFKMKENEILHEMMTRLTALTNELTSLGKAISEEEQVEKVLRVLPKSK